MKKIIFSLILLVSIDSPGDEIHLSNGKSIDAANIQILPETIVYKQKNSDIAYEVSREIVSYISFADGTVHSIDKQPDGLLFPFPLALNYTRSSGITDVAIYGKNNRKVAEGSAVIKQNKFSFSSEQIGTRFFITPETGYFYRTVAIKDFSKKVDEKNNSIISGLITDPLSGEVISNENVYSLKYNASFYSFFLDLKAGYQYATKGESVIFIINPYISGNALEYRKAIFSFKTSGRTEKFSDPYGFSYISSYGYGLSIGVYFPKSRLGVNINYDKRYFTKFDLPAEIKFKESYYDNAFQTTRAREVSVKYSTIEAHILNVIIYFIL